MGRRDGPSDGSDEDEPNEEGASGSDTMPPDGSYSELLREAILEATSRIVEDEGVQAATPTRIFTATGIARSTIYRHWPSKVELLDEALRRRNIQRADAESQLSDLERVIRESIARLEEDAFIRMLATILGYADVGDHDDNTKWKKLAIDLARSKSQEFHAYLSEAKVDGRVPDALSIEEIIALALGPILYLRFLTREPVSEAMVKQIIELIRDRVEEAVDRARAGESKEK